MTEQLVRSPEDKAQEIRYNLKHAIESQPADALLLSGGIDSGLLCALDPHTPAITVVLEGQGVDASHAQKVAEHFGTPWYLVEISQEQAIADLQDLVQLTHSFDLGILNDIPIYEGIKYAASRGWRTVRTGDAADTLFAGYSYLQNKDFDIKSYLKDLLPHFTVASAKIGRQMGSRMTYPYLHQEVIDSVLNLKLSDNVAIAGTDRPGDFHRRNVTPSAQGHTWGKIALRNAAYGILPEYLIWRTKTDLEYGSGTYTLEEILESSLSPNEEELLRENGKHFWNKAHGKLFLIADSLGIKPKPPESGKYECTWCGGGVIGEIVEGEFKGTHYCATCGAYPADEPAIGVFHNEEA